MKETIRNRFEEHRKVIDETEQKLPDQIAQAAEMIIDCCKSGGELFVFGNGGSAADAQHITGELVGRFLKERRSIKARALTVDSSILTSVANDYTFDMIFARQLEVANEGDVALGLSTSGNSGNVVNALEYAKNNNLRTIAVTGQGGGRCGEVADILIDIPSDETPRIQEATELIFHILCELVEEAFAG